MSLIGNQIRKTLLPGMYLPDSFELLFNWIDLNDEIFVNDGRYVGSIFPRKELKDNEVAGGTDIEFSAEGNEHLKYWFDHEDPDVIDRLYVFAQTGAEGSIAAFWLNPENEQKIVHLGSGSGSHLTCVLANDPVDFLRLIAIGYDEICWPEEFLKLPKSDLFEDDNEYTQIPNRQYRKWVEQTFSVTIPSTASEIVKHPSSMGDEDPQDSFCKWIQKY